MRPPSEWSSKPDDSRQPSSSPAVPSHVAANSRSSAARRGRGTLLTVLVIVTVAVVALGALIGFIVVPLMTSPAVIPSVEFGAAEFVNGNETFAVTAISSPTSVVWFEANLRIGSSIGTASSIIGVPLYSVVVLSNERYRIYWGDVDGQSLLSRGDIFTVTGDGFPLPVGTVFTSYLIWKSPTQVVATASWTTPGGGYQKPLVTFSSVTLSSGNATIGVAGASQSVSPSNYKVNLQVGTNTGTAVAMPTTGGLFATLTVGAPAVTYRIYWTDIGGEKTVNSGDNFRVTGNNVPLPAATSFTFYLLWSDGSSIQSTPWSTP